MSDKPFQADPASPEPGAIGFYRPDPGHNKSPNIVLEVRGAKLLVFEVPVGMVFEIDREDWMNVDDFRAHITAVQNDPRYSDDQDAREILLDGYFNALCDAIRVAPIAPTLVRQNAVSRTMRLEDIASKGSVLIDHDRARGLQANGYTITVKDGAGGVLVGTVAHDDEMDDLVGPVLASTLRTEVEAGEYSHNLNPVEIMGIRGSLAARIEAALVDFARGAKTPDMVKYAMSLAPLPLQALYDLWDQFDAACDDDGRLATGFLHFPIKTPREAVWRWFEQQDSRFVVGEVMQGIRRDEAAGEKFIVMCAVSGGVTGPREKPMSEKGRIMVFDTRGAAEAAAVKARKAMSQHQGLAQFRYWVAPATPDILAHVQGQALAEQSKQQAQDKASKDILGTLVEFIGEHGEWWADQVAARAEKTGEESLTAWIDFARGAKTPDMVKYALSMFVTLVDAKALEWDGEPGDWEPILLDEARRITGKPGRPAAPRPKG